MALMALAFDNKTGIRLPSPGEAANLLLKAGYSPDQVRRMSPAERHTAMAAIGTHSQTAPHLLDEQEPDYGVERIKSVPEANTWIRHRDFRNPRKSAIYFIGNVGLFRHAARPRLLHLETLADHATASRPRPKAEAFEIERIQSALAILDLFYHWARESLIVVSRRPVQNGSMLNIATRLRRD